MVQWVKVLTTKSGDSWDMAEGENKVLQVVA